jgi:hypothetical protein
MAVRVDTRSVESEDSRCVRSWRLSLFSQQVSSPYISLIISSNEATHITSHLTNRLRHIRILTGFLGYDLSSTSTRIFRYILKLGSDSTLCYDRSAQYITYWTFLSRKTSKASLRRKVALPLGKEVNHRC